MPLAGLGLCDYCYHELPVEQMAVPNSRLGPDKKVQIEMARRNVCQKCSRRYLMPIPSTPEGLADHGEREKALEGAKRPKKEAR